MATEEVRQTVFPDLQHLSSTNIQRLSSDIKIFHLSLSLSLGLAVCLSPEPSEPLIEICNTMQCTINLQKTHYLIVRWGTQALPGRWWKGKWNERRTVSPVSLMLMEWADRLNEQEIVIVSGRQVSAKLPEKHKQATVEINRQTSCCLTVGCDRECKIHLFNV